MRWLRLAKLLCFAAAGAPAIGAQGPYATDPLVSGRLRVWVVEPAPPAQPNADRERATLHQSTAGDFGRTAGSVGQTAGSYGGGSAGDLGHPASLEGQPAGSYGQTAGSLGQTAGSVGQTAGSYGVAAGDLGTVATTGPTEVQAPSFLTVPLDARWTTMARRLRGDFPGLKADVLAVSAADLASRLAIAAQAHALPDVLLGDNGLLSLQVAGTAGLAAGSATGLAAGLTSDQAQLRSLIRQGTVVPLGLSVARPQGSSGFVPPLPSEAAPLVQATDAAEARAMIVWLRDGMRAHWESDWVERGSGPDAGPEASEAANVAVGAAEALLQGGSLGAAADPAIAAFQPGAVQLAALRPRRAEALNGLAVQVDVLRAVANERFAVVMLRAIVGSSAAFGVVHPLVVLRRGTGASADFWQVLQITPDLAPDLLQDAFTTLTPSATRVPPQRVTRPAGVTLAAPVDGDVRSASPELWWDNGGSDRLLIVEWKDGQAGSHMFFVPDRGGVLQTRVSALFATVAGTYRWRVWAVGTGGLVKLSGWRQFVVTR